MAAIRSMCAQASEDEPRGLTAPLLAAILTFPLLFVWLLLRPGYSSDLRAGGFLYAFLLPALRLADIWLSGGLG